MNYRVNNHKIEVQDPNSKKYHVYCEEVAITKVIIDLLTQRRQVEIALYADPDPVTFRLERGAINRNVLPELINYGLTVVDNKDEAEFLLQVLLESEPAADVVYEHSCLGFQMIDGGLVFLAHHPIGASSPQKALSEYADPVKTKPVGTLDSWRRIMRDEVLGHENLELALALSVTAPVAYLLREAKIIPLIPLWALIGKTSTGKSTTLKCIASLWGSPEESRGLVTDLNATQNAFFAQLANSCGFPALIDETSSVPEWDFGKVIYNLPKGRDKLRCDQHGQVRKPVYFSGAVILTGERSLFEQTNGNAGLAARLVEFQLPWTDDEHHAQRLEYGCRCNYGTAVYPLMEWLLKNKDALPVTYERQYRLLKCELPISPGVEDRLLKMYAIILLAAKVIKASLHLPVDVDRLRELLLEVHRENPHISKDPALVFEKVKLQILENYACFPGPEPTASTRKVWGVQDRHQGQNAVWISESKFKEFLANAGVTDVDEVKKAFHEHGWIYRSADRHYRFSHTLGGVKVPCYCLFLTLDRPARKIISPNRKALLEPDDEVD